VTGQRAALDYSLSRSFHMPWGRSEAELLSFFRSYELDQPLADYQDNSPSIQANGIRLFTEVNFERRTSLFGADWIQSIQPAVQYLNIGTQSQSRVPIFDTRNASPSYSGLFRTNRFVGGDRVGDADRITLGVTSRLIDPAHGNQVARFSVGQAFYLEDRKVHANELIQLGLDAPEAYALDDPLYLLALERQDALNELARNQSNLIAEAEFRLSSEWIVTTDAHLNTSTGGLERGHLNFSYLANDSLSAFNFSYRFVKNNSNFLDINGDALIQSTELFEGNTSQYDLSGLHAVNDNWVLVARWQQDTALDRSIEKLMGIRYDSCCWSVGVFWRDWLKRDDDVLIPQTDLRQDNGIFISFELKGLAGVGQGIENLLENGIPGYNRETF
jgi:LPS-assembly protein